jgi:hypothetical protein
MDSYGLNSHTMANKRIEITEWNPYSNNLELVQNHQSIGL